MLIHRHSSKLSIPSRYRTVVLLCTLFTVVNLAWYMAIYGFGATRGFKDILKAASLGEVSKTSAAVHLFYHSQTWNKHFRTAETSTANWKE